MVAGKIAVPGYLAYQPKIGTPLTTILPSTIVCRQPIKSPKIRSYLLQPCQLSILLPKPPGSQIRNSLLQLGICVPKSEYDATIPSPFLRQCVFVFTVALHLPALPRHGRVRQRQPYKVGAADRQTSGYDRRGEVLGQELGNRCSRRDGVDGDIVADHDRAKGT